MELDFHKRLKNKNQRNWSIYSKQRKTNNCFLWWGFRIICTVCFK